MEFIEITLSPGNINQGHFYIPKNTKIFPTDSWGGKNKSQIGRVVEIHFEGIAELVLTDIDGEKRLLRNARGQAKRFIRLYKLKPDDVIFISRIEERLFKVSTKRSTSSIIPESSTKEIDNSTTRKDTTISRIVRDTAIAQKIKSLYDFKCQVCDLQIVTSSGLYAEGAHIKGLGIPHNGPDIESNILCLCPNHHVMFDKGCFTINEDFSLNGISGILFVDNQHDIDAEYLEYHKNNS